MKPFFPESNKPGDRQVYRLRPGTTTAGTDGRPQKTYSQTEITSSTTIRPVSKRTLSRLAEGRRQDVEMEVSSDAELRSADPEGDHDADKIKIVDNDQGTTEVFQVVKAKRFGTFLPHYEAGLLREQES